MNTKIAFAFLQQTVRRRGTVYPRFLAMLLLLLLICEAHGQQKEWQNEQRLEELTEQLIVSEEQAAESSTLIEDLSYYAEHPIHFNRTSEDELTKLSLLNYKQIRLLLEYRKRYGQILSPEEFKIAGNFTDAELTKLKPFLYFEPVKDSVSLRRERRVRHLMLNRVRASFPEATGFASQNGKPAAYVGNPLSTFTRYRGEWGKKLTAGFTAENDAGEAFLTGSNNYRPDFLSGFLCWTGEKQIKKIVIGDYHLRFGQGVSLWSGGGVSYGSDLSSLMRTSDGIRPYSSTDENQFFRGLAFQMEFKPVRLSFFYSQKYRDASLETDSLDETFITAFRIDGMHRTVSELKGEKNAMDRLTGAYADFRFASWRFGLLSAFQQFGYPIDHGSQPYKSKTIEGDANRNFSLDYQWMTGNLSLFGEAGISANGKLAVLSGLVWKPHPQLSASVLYRNYDPAFHASYSGAYASGSGTRNENGLNTNLEILPVKGIKLTIQVDLHAYPWLTYSAIPPAFGNMQAFQLQFSPKSTWLIYLHGRQSIETKKISGSTGVPSQFMVKTSKYRLHGEWSLGEYWQFRSRLDWVHYQYNTSPENGFMAYQDVIFAPSPLAKFWLRLAYYRTDSYYSSVYSYENDLLYYYAIPSFYGNGWRTYINLRCQLLQPLTIYAKAGYTIRYGATTMGSGNDQTAGNYRMDIRFQLCWRF